MVHADDYGLVLPPRVAPKQVVIIPIGNDEKVKDLCNNFNANLNDKGIVTYIDDSEKTPGFKFAEAEVNGIPIRIEIGARDLANGIVTVVRRDTREKITKKVEELTVDYIAELLDAIQKDMYDRALERQNKLTFEAHNLKEMEDILNKQPGFIHAMWCGNPECENKIKEIKGCKSRCILEDGKKIDDKCVCCSKEAKHHVVWGIQY